MRLGWRWAGGVLLIVAAACGSPDGSTDAGSPADAAADVASMDGRTGDGGAAADGRVERDAGAPLRVLFVGNSYTSQNDLPSVVQALATVSPGPAVEAEAVTEGGALLEDHWSSTGARERIEAGVHDAVVMQGQSMEPFAAGESFGYYGEEFASLLDELGVPGVWFATWARAEGDPLYDAPAWNPESMTRAIEDGYGHIAERHDDTLARVGAAWQVALAELPDVTLHRADGSHPTPAGTLLAGCVILQAVTGQTPRTPDPPPLGVPLETAQALCAIAPRVKCPDDRTFCDGGCVDLARDPLHCGGCGEECAAADPCRDGECGCEPGLTGCSRICYDLSTSSSHCGDCDTSCTDGELCQDGSCVCPAASAQDITYDQLAALRPGCESNADAGSLACLEAAHEHCASLACFDAGFGPPSGHAPMPRAVMCVAGDVHTATYGELAVQAAGCDGTDALASQSCASAISRYCASTGAVSGFGPVESTDDGVSLTCVSSATVVETTMTELSAFASRCEAHPATCSVASWNFCESMGYPGGFGPVEVSGEDAEVVCLEP